MIHYLTTPIFLERPEEKDEEELLENSSAYNMLAQGGFQRDQSFDKIDATLEDLSPRIGSHINIPRSTSTPLLYQTLSR